MIDGVPTNTIVVIDRGSSKAEKKLSKKFTGNQFGHTPLSIEEKIPWKCVDCSLAGNGCAAGDGWVKRGSRASRIELLICRQRKPSENGAQSDRHERHPACHMLVPVKTAVRDNAVFGD